MSVECRRAARASLALPRSAGQPALARSLLVMATTFSSIAVMPPPDVAGGTVVLVGLGAGLTVLVGLGFGFGTAEVGLGVAEAAGLAVTFGFFFLGVVARGLGVRLAASVGSSVPGASSSVRDA